MYVRQKQYVTQELYLLLASIKEHKTVFPNVLIARFCNDKSLRDCLAEAVLPKTKQRDRKAGYCTL